MIDYGDYLTEEATGTLYGEGEPVSDSEDYDDYDDDYDYDD